MTRSKRRTDRIVVSRPEIVDRNTVVCRFEPVGAVRSAFRTDMYVATYERADLREAPDSLLLIPLVSILAPIAWARNAELRVPAMDPVFLSALDEIKESLKSMYPKIGWNGRISPRKVKETPPYPAERPALLFSGGIDSVASFLVHRDENPLLVTALGRSPFQDLSPGVIRQRALCAAFAEKRGARFSPVLTNLDRMLSVQGLPLGAAWWTKVEHGLAFLGLCAPISPAETLGTVYLAATHTADFGSPWGSHPSIDNHVAWGSTRAQHDCYHLSRQQKVELIARHIQTEDPELVIQICRRSPDYGNCSRCGKCCRTMIGLAVAGVDPNRHGFRLDRETLEHLRARLADGEFLRSANNRFMWWDIQRRLPGHASVEVEGLESFFSWFREFQIDV